MSFYIFLYYLISLEDSLQEVKFEPVSILILIITTLLYLPYSIKFDLQFKLKLTSKRYLNHYLV